MPKGHAATHHEALQHHFDSLQQQKHASTFGMWVFLVTEVLFFGGMFMAYILFACLRNPALYPKDDERMPLAAILIGMLRIRTVIVLILAVVGAGAFAVWKFVLDTPESGPTSQVLARS